MLCDCKGVIETVNKSYKKDDTWFLNVPISICSSCYEETISIKKSLIIEHYVNNHSVDEVNFLEIEKEYATMTVADFLALDKTFKN